MAKGRKAVDNPNEVVTLEDGSQIRPGRFVSSSLEGLSFAAPGEELPAHEDDFDPDAPDEEHEPAPTRRSRKAA